MTQELPLTDGHKLCRLTMIKSIINVSLSDETLSNTPSQWRLSQHLESSNPATTLRTDACIGIQFIINHTSIRYHTTTPAPFAQPRYYSRRCGSKRFWNSRCSHPSLLPLPPSPPPQSHTCFGSHDAGTKYLVQASSERDPGLQGTREYIFQESTASVLHSGGWG